MASICRELKLELTKKDLANCTHCKHAIASCKNFYCVKLKQHVENATHCRYFEPEPLEYKLYKRM